MGDRAIRMISGVWFGLIDGLEWLGRQVEEHGWHLLAGAIYGALMTYWLVGR